jgi:hypothetical protein
VLGGAALAAAIGSARVASACSPPFCSFGVTLPEQDPSLLQFPGNLVRFLDGGAGARAPAPRMTTETGAPVPLTLRAGAWGPVAERLATGVYFLTFDQRCFPQVGNPGPVPEPRSVSFGVDDPAAAPAVAGELVVEERGTFDDGNNKGTFVRLRLEPTSEMGLFLSLTTWQLRVDGRLFYPDDRRGEFVPRSPPSITLDCFPGHATTGIADSCGFYRNVEAGRHRVSVSSSIAGLDVGPPPVELDVDVTCDPAPSDAGAPDASTVAPDASAVARDASAAAPDASTVTPDASMVAPDGSPSVSDAAAGRSPTTSAKHSGCALGGPSAQPGPIVLSLLAAALLLRRRFRAGAKPAHGGRLPSRVS